MSIILDARRRAEADRRHGDTSAARPPGEPAPPPASTVVDAPAGLAGVVLSAIVGLTIGFGGYALIGWLSSLQPGGQPVKTAPPAPAAGVGAGGTLPAQSWGGNGQLPGAGAARPESMPRQDVTVSPVASPKAPPAALHSRSEPTSRAGSVASGPVPPGARTASPAPMQPGRTAGEPGAAALSSPLSGSTAPSAQAGPPGPPSVPVATAPLPRLHELPPDLQREVPPLLVSGWVQSADPGSRQLLVNGVLLREGDALTPVLRLEMIGRRTAVFSVRGQRFEVPISL